MKRKLQEENGTAIYILSKLFFVPIMPAANSNLEIIEYIWRSLNIAWDQSTTPNNW
jgi:hypothetical protein